MLRMEILEFNNNDDIIYKTPNFRLRRRAGGVFCAFWKITGELGFSYGAFSEREDYMVLLITVN